MVSNLLFINRIKIGGNWLFDQTFELGLNAIYADNQKGKTTLIQLIMKALAISDKIDSICRQNVNEILVELKLNFREYTIKNIRNGNWKYYISDDWVIDDLQSANFIQMSKDDIRNKIEEELNINEYMRREGSSTITILNNIGQCYRCFYLLQGKEGEVIASFSDIRRTVIKSLLRNPSESNIFNDRRIQLKDDAKDLRNQRDLNLTYLMNNFNDILKILTEYELINSIFDFDENYLVTFFKNHEVEHAIEKKINEKQELANMLSEQIEKFILQNKINEDKKYNQINAEIHKETDRKNEKLNEINRLTMEEKKLEEDLNKTVEKINGIQRKIENESHTIEIIGIKTHNCPRCQRPISSTMYLREKQDDPRCALCDRILNLQPRNAIDDLNEILRNLTQEKEENNRLIEEINHSVNEEKLNMESINNKLMELRTRLIEYENSFYSRIQNNLSELSNEKNEVNENLNNFFNTLSSIREYIQKLGSFTDIKNSLQKINRKARNLHPEVVVIEEIHDFWVDSIRDFLEYVLDIEISDISLKESTGELEIDGRRRKTDHEKNMICIAYYYGFLKTSLVYDIKYPRLVILDCFATEELTVDKSRRIIRKFLELKNEFEDKEFQVFFFTAKPEILEFRGEINIIEAEEGEFLFN